jgi:metallo-beta-lactamase class B
MTPFKIFGGTYFIGTYQASCHLIDTEAGLIMIDPGYSSTAYLIIDAIYRLGFRPEDIKYIINTHWHGDHTEATADIAALTGAKTLIGRFDAEKAAKYFTPDILVDDGYVLKLGNKEITFLHTPGHTRGTISPFYYETDGKNTYRVGMFGGAGLNTLIPGKYDFDGAREAYFSSLERLMGQEVDIFIGNHTWNNGTLEKYETMIKTGENLFIDPTLWPQFIREYKKRLEDLIRKEGAV